MSEKKMRPHPNLISNWTRKTQAKVGWMLMDLVLKNEGKDHIEISGIVELSKKYHLGDKTFVKYLKNSIYKGEDQKNNKKTLVLGKIDIILIKEIMYLEERYENLEKPQKNLIRCLIAKLGRTL